MKKLTVLLVLVASLLLLISVASAAPITYNSGFQVQNLSSVSTGIIITFYEQNGVVKHTLSDTIAANDSKNYFPLPTKVGAGFNGSLVIESDQPVASIANVLGDGFEFGASYGSLEEGAQSVNLPLIFKGNAGQYDTWFNVQNAGASDVDISVSYAGTACVEAFSGLKSGAAHTFDQTDNACLPASYVGAALVTSEISGAPGGSIVATVIQTGDETLYAYNGFTVGSADPVMPLVQFNNVGYQTGIQIQNTGGSSTNVTVSYTPSVGAPGTPCTETQTIIAGNSATFGLFAFTYPPPSGTTTNCTLGQQFVGSAQVTANSGNHDLVAIVNQTNFTNYGSSYNGFNVASASSTVSMPLIMDRNAGYYTGFNVMNVGSSSTTVNCTFSNATYTVNQVVAAGGALNDLQLNEIADRYVGGGTCTASGSGSIVAVVNELGNSTTADLLFTYEGFNQ